MSNGLFCVTLDFGEGIFTGRTRWLDIAVRTNGASSFTALNPRQPLTPTPYAVMAGCASNLLGGLPTAQLNGMIPVSQLSGTPNAAVNFIGGLNGDVTGTQRASVVSSVGGSTAANVHAAELAANAATSADAPNTMVKRDADGNFTTGTITLAGQLNLAMVPAIYWGNETLLHEQGIDNFFAGSAAGNRTMSGCDNTGVGDSALFSNASGSENTAYGGSALAYNTSGGANTASGFEALYSNTNGSGNTAGGAEALFFNANGNGNTADGLRSLFYNTNGSCNIALGYQAGYYVTGSNNIEIGNAGDSSDNGIIRLGTPGTHTNTFVAGVIHGNGGGLTNLNAATLSGAIGSLSVTNLTVNHAIYDGTNTLLFASGSGLANFFAGVTAGNATMSGNENTAVGRSALGLNTSGSWNTAGGWDSLAQNTSGFCNTAEGSTALRDNTNGTWNSALGANALLLNTSGSYNTAVGADALYGNATGSKNIAVGYYAGYFLTTGSSNIDIGNPGVATDTNIIRIGSAQTQTFIAGVLHGDGGGLTNLNMPLSGGLILQQNTNGAPNVIAGSSANFVSSGIVGATISGGGATNYNGTRYTNSVSANFGTIGGGAANVVQANAGGSTIGGGGPNTIQTNTWDATISGGDNNTIESSAYHSTIAGGDWNRIQAAAGDCAIGGGSQNVIQPGVDGAAIGGGYWNTIQTNAHSSVISGGNGNTIRTNAEYATIGGGFNNTAGALDSTIAGGSYNTIYSFADRSTISGGFDNTVPGKYAMVPGGAYNWANGDYSFAAGFHACAGDAGAFVWADDTPNDFYSVRTNTFQARASGGVYFFSNPAATVGVGLLPGSGSWTSLSDRNAKENFAPVNAQIVLAKVAALPLSTWNYKSQPAAIRHIGPMAQDFKAAFAVGESDKGISTIDADGVALAAIQGLNQKLEQKETEIAELKRQLKQLSETVNALSQKLNGGGQ